MLVFAATVNCTFVTGENRAVTVGRASPLLHHGGEATSMERSDARMEHEDAAETPAGRAAGACVRSVSVTVVAGRTRCGRRWRCSMTPWRRPPRGCLCGASSCSASLGDRLCVGPASAAPSFGTPEHRTHAGSATITTADNSRAARPPLTPVGLRPPSVRGGQLPLHQSKASLLGILILIVAAFSS